MSVRVLSWVLQSSPVDNSAHRLVLIVLGDHAHDDGNGSYPSVATIARKAHLTPRGVHLALRALEEAGAIERTGTGPSGTVVYRVAMGGERGAGGGERGAGEGCTTRHLGGERRSPEPSLEPSIETTPPNPPGGNLPDPSLDEIPSPPPKGGRDRDRERWKIEQVHPFAERHFPQIPDAERVGLVCHGLSQLEGDRQEPTLDNLRPIVERWATTTAREEAAPCVG